MGQWNAFPHRHEPRGGSKCNFSWRVEIAQAVSMVMRGLGLHLNAVNGVKAALQRAGGEF